MNVRSCIQTKVKRSKEHKTRIYMKMGALRKVCGVSVYCRGHDNDISHYGL